MFLTRSDGFQLPEIEANLNLIWEWENSRIIDSASLNFFAGAIVEYNETPRPPGMSAEIKPAAVSLPISRMTHDDS